MDSIYRSISSLKFSMDGNTNLVRTWKQKGLLQTVSGSLKALDVHPLLQSHTPPFLLRPHLPLRDPALHDFGGTREKQKQKNLHLNQGYLT